MGKAKLLLACSLCDLICKRGVILPCCGLSSKACRNCAVKRITETRECWACGESDVAPSQFINSSELRDACKFYEDTGELDDHHVQKLESVDDRMIEKLRNEHLRNVNTETESERYDINNDDKKLLQKLLHTENLKRKEVEEQEKRTESERDGINDFHNKKLLQKLLHTENLKRKKVEKEEKLTGIRKRAVKDICNDKIIKENKAAERRSQEIERREQIWMQARLNLSSEKVMSGRLANKGPKKWKKGGELKPFKAESQNFPKTMDVRGYGHRDGLGYSYGRGIRKRIL